VQCTKQEARICLVIDCAVTFVQKTDLEVAEQHFRVSRGDRGFDGGGCGFSCANCANAGHHAAGVVVVKPSRLSKTLRKMLNNATSVRARDNGTDYKDNEENEHGKVQNCEADNAPLSKFRLLH